MGFIIPVKKLSVDPIFSLFPGFYSVVDFAVSSQIIGFSFESDLCDPLLAFLVPVDTVVAAGICADKGVKKTAFEAGFLIGDQ